MKPAFFVLTLSTSILSLLLTLPLSGFRTRVHEVGATHATEWNLPLGLYVADPTASLRVDIPLASFSALVTSDRRRLEDILPKMDLQSTGNLSSVTAWNFFSPLDSILVPFAANMVLLARLPVHGTASTWQSSSFGMTSAGESESNVIRIFCHSVSVDP